MNREPMFTGTPFKEPLVPTDLSISLYTLPSDPNKLVRTSSPWHGLQKHIVARSMFRELSQKYGIPVVRTNEVMGYDPAQKKNTIYSVTEKVNGENLYELYLNRFERNVTAPFVFDQFYSRLAHYFRDKLTQGGNYLWDLTNDNFVYGKLSTDRNKKIYLVDVNPWSSNFDLNNVNPDENNGLFLSTITLFHQIEDMEEKLASRRLRRARKALYGLTVDAINSPVLSPHFLEGTLDLRKKADSLHH